MTLKSLVLIASMAVVPVTEAWGADAPACADGAMLWDRTELYFGLSKPDGVIGEDEFAAFMDREVTPRFPDGLTMMTARGQWRNDAGEVLKEVSRMVILLHPRDDGVSARIEEVRSAYKAEFEQQSVLLVTGSNCVSF